MLKILHLTVNGQETEVAIDPRESLTDLLRNRLGLTSVKKGCEVGECGACTVLVNDKPVFSCLTPCGALAGKSVRTVESLGSIDQPGPLQKAFINEQAAQCGYCIAGMIVRAQALLESNPH
ncbi:MAG: 2Fe-2S iron-sulfur cluster-binding protein, partial [Oscillospiraceae bacterium]